MKMQHVIIQTDLSSVTVILDFLVTVLTAQVNINFINNDLHLVSR